MSTVDATAFVEEDILIPGWTISTISPALGVEITGADVRGLDERQLTFVRDCLLRYSVVVLHGQTITPDEQLGFLKRLYPLRPGAYAQNRDALLPGYPQITVVSNIEVDGRKIGTDDAGLFWHTDTCYERYPELFVSLHGKVIPVDDDGRPLGGTAFRSTAAAYDALPDERRARLEELEVAQSYSTHLARMREAGLLTRRPIDKPDVAHPLIRVHPVTGRRCIYVNESFSSHVIGMSKADSDALLGELYEYISRPEFSIVHTWTENDLVVWDNSVTQHRALKDYAARPRRLHRCSTLGPAPEAVGVR